MFKTITILFIFVVMLSIHKLHGQSIVIDSATAQAYKLRPATAVKTEQKPQASENDNKSFVGLMENLGKGLLNKLKRRFNVDALKDKVVTTKGQIQDTFKSKKEGSTKKPSKGQTRRFKNKKVHFG